ncbi:MAG: hypothetical protein H2069_00420 [Legionella sp.]|nr:hypothetical protein [Legionella sp.]
MNTESLKQQLEALFIRIWKTLTQQINDQKKQLQTIEAQLKAITAQVKPLEETINANQINLTKLKINSQAQHEDILTKAWEEHELATHANLSIEEFESKTDIPALKALQEEFLLEETKIKDNIQSASARLAALRTELSECLNKKTSFFENLEKLRTEKAAKSIQYQEILQTLTAIDKQQRQNSTLHETVNEQNIKYDREIKKIIHRGPTQQNQALFDLWEDYFKVSNIIPMLSQSKKLPFGNFRQHVIQNLPHPHIPQSVFNDARTKLEAAETAQNQTLQKAREEQSLALSNEKERYDRQTSLIALALKNTHAKIQSIFLANQFASESNADALIQIEEIPEADRPESCENSEYKNIEILDLSQQLDEYAPKSLFEASPSLDAPYLLREENSKASENAGWQNDFLFTNKASFKDSQNMEDKIIYNNAILTSPLLSKSCSNKTSTHGNQFNFFLQASPLSNVLPSTDIICRENNNKRDSSSMEVFDHNQYSAIKKICQEPRVHSTQENANLAIISDKNGYEDLPEIIEISDSPIEAVEATFNLEEVKQQLKFETKQYQKRRSFEKAEQPGWTNQRKYQKILWSIPAIEWKGLLRNHNLNFDQIGKELCFPFPVRISQFLHKRRAGLIISIEMEFKANPEPCESPKPGRV